MIVKRAGLITDSRSRTIKGWFGSGLMIIRRGEVIIRDNSCHKITPVFGWYLCRFRGYRKVDCSFGIFKFDGYSKKI